MNPDEAFRKYVEMGCTEERARELVEKGKQKWWDIMDEQLSVKTSRGMK